MVKTKNLDFNTAFNFPFNRKKGLLNIFWILLPIIGWFALSGYLIRIIQGFIKGKYKETPLFDFKDNLNVGFFMFLKGIPFMLVYYAIIFVITVIVNAIGIPSWSVDIITSPLSILVIPVMALNFIKNETAQAFFEFKKLKYVFRNFKEYIIALLKELGLGLIYMLMCIILIGIPALAFTKNIFMSDFYRRYVK